MIVQVDNLKKTFKKQKVLQGINISIEKPQIIALVGPNGAGKTTLLNCMTNLLPFEEGDVTLLGKKHADVSLFYDVSYLQDNRILYGNLTGDDHLKFICSVQNIQKSRIKEITERVGMRSYIKKKVRNYSLGMKQHLLLAMVTLNEPKLLLMDEPLNGLDPTSAINMRSILLELAEEGTTIIVSSHNLAEIDKLTDTIYFMKDGILLKESARNFAVNHYFFTVSETGRAKELLAAEKLPVTFNPKGQITFEETDVPLQSVIDTLNKHQITIEKMENERIGAEKRYRELFEGNMS